jgi:hypothetical protein
VMANSRQRTSTVNFSDVEDAKHRFRALPTTGSNAGCESNAAPCRKAIAAVVGKRQTVSNLVCKQIAVCLCRPCPALQ